jgi:hypothetical protein
MPYSKRIKVHYNKYFTSKAAVASRMAAFGFFILMYTVAGRFQDKLKKQTSRTREIR